MLDRDQYARFRVSPLDPATLRCRHVEQSLQRLTDASRGRLRVEQFAESVEGRPIYMATIGAGPRRVLLWTQMHGDEPTHTAVVLDLLSYFNLAPDEPITTNILTGTTLHIIPMLNPDGAEVFSRFNAQGIDINRDFQHLATPEGRALRKAVETLKPEFGFNLHNQNARTSVGTPPRPAVASVLAPPPDARRSETPAMRRAKQMCACFVEAVRPYAARMISRYDDTYEPRAFGDGIQSLGTATMLIEAGGWHEPDPEPLTRLHFHGLVDTLLAIASDRYQHANIDAYETLPRSNSRMLNDCLIAGGHVLDATTDKPFRADLAIDQSHGHRIAVTARRDGRIVDVGDLSTMAGKLAIDAAGSLILPGRIAYLRDWTPGSSLDGPRLDTLLAAGTTTVLGSVDLADRDAIEAISTPQELPINWGFLARLDGARGLERGEFLERVALAAAQGVLAVVGNGADEAVWQRLDHFGLPLLQEKQLPGPPPPGGSHHEVNRQLAAAVSALKLSDRRGRVTRGHVADLALFDRDSPRLKRLIVAGETVWQDGHRTTATPGTHLRR